tara:strand:+ start:1288 stop:1542 length:255 start_codon:yes stop_codon:yes gene_type:complete
MAELTVQDVGNALQIIDECSRRGAFQGNELQSVGSVRDKLAAYVEENTPKPDPVEPPAPPEIPTPEEAVESVVDFPEENEETED